MESLENVKAGDRLVVSNRYGENIDVVERITETLVITKIHRFRKKDGYESGQSAYACGFSRARLATEADVERIKGQMRKRKLTAECNKIRFDRLSVQQLDDILKIAGAESKN